MDSEHPVCWGKRTQELFSVFLYHQNLGNYNLTRTYNIFSRLPFSFGLCFLPQMYLKRWSEEGKIKEYKLLVSHENVPIWTIRPIRKAAVQGNLYVRIEDGVEYDDIEHWFDKHFENPAARALEKACNGEKMTSEDWNKLIDFVIAQYVRTPAFHQWTMEMGKAIVPSVLDEVAQKIASVTPEEIKNMDLITEFNSLNINLGTGRLGGVNSMIRFLKNL